MGDMAVKPIEKSAFEAACKVNFESLYELACRAHSGTSFSPEKRGEAHVAEVKSHLNAIHNSLSAHLSGETLERAFDWYCEKYMTKYNAWLHAKSRCLSSMITGPANFPSERNRKANNAEHNRCTELIEWEKKITIDVMLKMFAPDTYHETAKNIDLESFERVVMRHIATIKSGGSYARALLQGKIERKIKNRDTAAADLGIKLVREHSVFLPGNKLFKLYETIKSTEPEQREKKEYKIHGITVVENFDIDRVQILFGFKPSEEVRAELKKTWNYSGRNQAWQRKITPNAIESARKIIETFFDSSK